MFELDWLQVQTWLLTLLPKMGFFILAMLLDLVGGVGIALYRKELRLELVPGFLITGMLYLLAWLSSEVIALMVPLFGIVPAGWLSVFVDYGPDTVFATILATKYGASIVGHLRTILALPAPVLYVLDAIGVQETSRKIDRPVDVTLHVAGKEVLEEQEIGP